MAPVIVRIVLLAPTQVRREHQFALFVLWAITQVPQEHQIALFVILVRTHLPRVLAFALIVLMDRTKTCTDKHLARMSPTATVAKLAHLVIASMFPLALIVSALVQ